MQTFEQWWNEIEGFGLRAERFTNPGEAAKAAWDQALSLHAQADARPVAWCRRDTVQDWQGQSVNVAYMFPSPAGLKDPIPLYTHPEASAPGLSDEERKALDDMWKATPGVALTRASAAPATPSSVRKALQYALSELGKPPFGGVVDCTPIMQALIDTGGVDMSASAATVAEPSELEMHRADYQAIRAAGFHDPGELLDAYKKLQAAQQQTNQGASHEWDATGERCLKCGDKDWFAGSTCSGKATQQQAEPRAYEHVTGPRVPEIDRVLAAQQQAGPGADEREREALAAFSMLYSACTTAMFAMGKDGANASVMHPMREAWEQCREAEQTAQKAMAKHRLFAAQSGQRAGVADVAVGEEWYARLPHASALIHCWVRDVTAETVLLRENNYTNGVRYLRSEVTFIERIAAAPTQQQEGGK